MLRTLFVVVVLMIGMVAASRDRFAGLLLYLWFALFRPLEWIWWDLSSLRLSLVVGLLLVVPAFLTGVFPYLAHPLSIGSVVFLFAGLLAQMNPLAPDTGWAWLDFFFRLLLVCLLTTRIVSNPGQFRVTIAVVAGSFGFHTAKAGLASLLGGGVRFAEGLAGAFVDNNGYAVGIAMIIPLLLAAGQNLPRRSLRLAFFVALPLSLLAIVSTYSRGGFLAALATGVALAAVQRRRMPAFALIATLAIPVGVFMVSQDGYLQRLQTIRTYEDTNEESALSRLHFWRVAVDMAVDQPLGVGFFNFEGAYDRYDTSGGEFGSRRSVHSSHFQALAETGFLGFITFEGLLAYACFCALRIRRRGLTPGLAAEDARLFITAGNALLASTVAFIVGGAFVAMALNDLTWLTLALVAALDRISLRVCAEAAEQARGQEDLRNAPRGLDWRPLSRPEAV